MTILINRVFLRLLARVEPDGYQWTYRLFILRMTFLNGPLVDTIIFTVTIANGTGKDYTKNNIRKETL